MKSMQAIYNLGSMNRTSRAFVLHDMNRLLLFLAISGGIASVVRADHQESERRREEPRVILYQDADFRGDSLVIYPGEAIDNFSRLTFSNGNGLNDKVSSIRVEGGAEVYVYEHGRFRGAVMRLTENVRDLTGRLLSDNPRDNWNDRISSLKVGGSRRHAGEKDDRNNDRDRNRAGDCDRIINQAYKDLLERAPDESGLRNYRGLMIDQGWTDRMVREHIQQSDEFRGEGADKIIRRAYRDVLGREVDPSGLKQFRSKLLDKNWTEGDVRDALRRSDEYRNKQAATINRNGK